MTFYILCSILRINYKTLMLKKYVFIIFFLLVVHNYIIHFIIALNNNTAFLNSCNQLWTYLRLLLFISLFEAYIIDLISNSRTPRGIYCPITNAVGSSVWSKNSGPYLTALAGVYCSWQRLCNLHIWVNFYICTIVFNSIIHILIHRQFNLEMHFLPIKRCKKDFHEDLFVFSSSTKSNYWKVTV